MTSDVPPATLIEFGGAKSYHCGLATLRSAADAARYPAGQETAP